MTKKEILLFRKTFGDRRYEEVMRRQRIPHGKTGSLIFHSKRDYNRQQNKLIRKEEWD